MNHPNIVTFIDFYLESESKDFFKNTDNNMLALITEMMTCNAQDFKKFFINWKYPLETERDIKLIAKLTAEALYYSHHCGIMYRDVRLTNILLQLGEQGKIKKVKLNNFGMSCQINQDGVHEPIETTDHMIHYMAPELLKRNKYYDEKIDSWALGVLLYQLITGHLPFRGDSRRLI